MAQTAQEHPQTDQEQVDSAQEQPESKGAASAQEHLLTHLRDTHAIELQALRQLARAVDCAQDETRKIYEEHLEQTKSHEQKIKELVEAQGHTSSVVEDKTLRGGAIGLRQLADIPLETPVKLAMNLFGLEHLEIATYELLVEIARATGEEDCAKAAEQILEEEHQAAENVAGTFDRAVEELPEGAEDAEDDSSLLGQLRDIHALEEQSLQLLRIAVEEICDDDELKRLYRDHLEQTEEHEKSVNERIEAHEAKPSAIRDLHMSTAKSGFHDLLKGPPDAPVKLAMNFFCVEHLKIAAYEMLMRLAKQAGDNETAQAAEKILEQERQAAEAVKGAFGHSVELMLHSEGSYDAVRAAERPREEDETTGAAGEQDEPNPGAGHPPEE